jgi:NitT/TauT family transport system substrate-binding protein
MNRSHRAAAAALVLAALCGVPLWARGSGEAASGEPAAFEKVHLAIGYIPHVQFTPLYVGVAKGFYRQEGIDLEISYGFGVDVFSLLAAGSIDLGLSDSDQLVLAGSKGLGLAAVFQYYQRYPVSIVAKRSTAAKPADLAGKVIGTPEMYGTSYIGLQLFLRKYGLADRVRVERIGYSQLESLEADRVDAVVCFSNNEPIVLAAHGVPVSEWVVRDFSSMVGASFISSRAIIAKRADALARFYRATKKAMAWTVDHRDEAFKIALETVGNVKPEEEPLFRKRLDATCELFPHSKGYGYLDRSAWEKSIVELAALGLVPAAYPADTILANIEGAR